MNNGCRKDFKPSNISHTCPNNERLSCYNDNLGSCFLLGIGVAGVEIIFILVIFVIVYLIISRSLRSDDEHEYLFSTHREYGTDGSENQVR